MADTNEVPLESVFPLWGAPPTLSSEQVDKYLVRLGLEAATIRQRPCDLELLTELQLAHCIRIPYESSAIHFVEDFEEAKQKGITSDTPFKLGEGKGVPTELADLYDRIVIKGRGAFCFGLNTSFSGLIRGLGFSVSESGARVYMNRNQDPKKVGYMWSPIVHMVLIVTFADKSRYLTDVGWGWGSFDRPVKLEHDAISHSLISSELVSLKNEPLPGADHVAMPDNENGWTLLRKFNDEANGNVHWTPCYAFVLTSFNSGDFTCFSYFNSFHPGAVFPSVLLCTRLLPNGSRQTLQYDRKMEAAGKKARYFVREGELGKIIEEEEVDLTYGAMAKCYRAKFGFKDLVGLRPEDDIPITFD